MGKAGGRCDVSTNYDIVSFCTGIYSFWSEHEQVLFNSFDSFNRSGIWFKRKAHYIDVHRDAASENLCTQVHWQKFKRWYVYARCNLRFSSRRSLRARFWGGQSTQERTRMTGGRGGSENRVAGRRQTATPEFRIRRPRSSWSSGASRWDGLLW